MAELKRVLAPRPLSTPEELEAFFVETAGGRDGRVGWRTALADRLDVEEPVKIIAYGHRGTGKSTELNRFAQEQAARYSVMRFSVFESHLLGQVAIEPLLVLTVEAVLDSLRRQRVDISDDTLKAVYGWFSETFEYREQDVQSQLAVGAGVDSGASWWGKLVGLQAFLKADVKAGCRVINKTVTRENRRLSELVSYCNLLIKEARLGLQRAKLPELLLVIEDLDKCTPQEAEAVFITNPAPLTALSCKAIYTAPIALRCSPLATPLDEHFESISLGVIKVAEKDGRPRETGRRVIREILQQRLDVQALIESDALELAIGKTGGVLRHLFDVLVDAALAAREAARREQRAVARIQAADVRWGLDQLESRLLNRISTVGLPEKYGQVTTAQLLERTRGLVGKAERAEADSVTVLLLNAQALIEYNGEGWCRLHPLVEEYYGAPPAP